jgi:hypothetical protein
MYHDIIAKSSDEERYSITKEIVKCEGQPIEVAPLICEKAVSATVQERG